jgi:hypothetical protein
MLLIINTLIINVFYFVFFIWKIDRNSILNMYTDIVKTYA